MKGTGTRPLGADILLSRARQAAAAMGTPGEVYVTSRRGGYTRFAGGQIHQPQEVEEIQLTARSFAAKGTARVSSTDLTAAATVGKEAARLAASQSWSTTITPILASPASDAGQGSAIWAATLDLDDGRRAGLAEQAMSRAGSVAASAHGMVSSVLIEMAVINSEGVERYFEATEASYSFLLTAAGGSAYRSDLVRDAARVDPLQLVEEALEESTQTRPQERLLPGAHDVVLGPLAVGNMLGFFGAIGFNGESLAEHQGAVANRAGRHVAARVVTVRDDATSSVGLPVPFDIEGTSKSPVTLLRSGRVGDAVLDLHTSALCGRASTGHAHVGREQAPAPTPANLILDPGEASLEELIAGVEQGVLISRLHYTRLVDPERTTITGVTRDYSAHIDHGRVTSRIENCRFNEAIFGALSRVDAVGRKLVTQDLPNVWNGCASAPALRVRGFHLGVGAT